jgi:penicillin-binding protein 2
MPGTSGTGAGRLRKIVASVRTNHYDALVLRSVFTASARVAALCSGLVLAPACGGKQPAAGAAVAAKESKKTEEVPPSNYVRGLLSKLPPGTSLTIDSALQAASERALSAAGRPGAIVAFEPDSGTVRALYSVPGDRGDPLLTAHVPASTFKVLATIAGLEAGALTPDTVETCDGRYPFHGNELRCSKAHGRETTADAITRSCNVFFYSMATHMDHWPLLEVARRFGFGARTGIELADAEGVVPDRARYEAVKRDPESTVPLLDAMGHGEVTVTLLQLSRAFAVIANGGRLSKLHVTRPGELERAVELRPQDLALVRKALFDAVESEAGTAHASAIPGFPLAGKTGGAEVPALGGEGEDEDKWFVAYAPPDAPKILVGARVERAAEDRGAMFVVRELLQAYRASVK